MRIAVLGLGIIGSTWAKNLQADGDEVRTWNRTPKVFQGFTLTASEAVMGAEIIIIVVADPPAVQAVLDQIVPRLVDGQVVVQSSTVSAEWTRRYAAQVEGAGARYLEAPFTGSKPAAEQRQTVFYVGGDEAALELARPALARLSKAILRIGALGSASSLKLAMNVNIALVGQALAESLTLARAAGVSDEVFFTALHLNASRSGLSDLKEPKLLAGDFTPQFSLKHMDKDLRLALETSAHNNLPLLHRTKKVYEEGMSHGWSDEDFSCLIKLLGAKRHS
jgi:3-hydroxyisobutyrate dehydrogenase-like beta-hydroxyacid dehydrogenase